MSIVSRILPNGPTGFGYGSTAEDVTRGLSLAGKTILVTGCNSGLGAEACRVLAERGAHVLATARSREKAQGASAGIRGTVTPYACELSDPSSVRACVEAVRQDGHTLDAVIANAGIMALPRLEKAHGYELQFFTNHVGHFMLVTGLLDRLAADGRVVMLSSSAHLMAPPGGIRFDNLDGSRGYQSWLAYGQSKMANLVFAKELARRFGGTRRTAYAVHPGVISTNLGRNLWMGGVVNAAMSLAGPLALKSVPQGAATEVFAAVHPKALPLAGGYLADCNAARSRRTADNPALGKRLWDESERIVAGLPR